MFFISSIIFSFIGLSITIPPVAHTEKEPPITSDINEFHSIQENIEAVSEESGAKEEVESTEETGEQESIVALSTNETYHPVQSNTGDVAQEPSLPPVEETHIAEETKLAHPSENLFLVTRVVDGDTIKVDIDGTIETLRLIGIDTPETVDPRKPVECFGKEASDKAKALLTGKKVRLEADPTQGDRGKYGRLLRYVWMEDGTFFNKKMISDGYAFEYTYILPYKYQQEFKNAEQYAKNNQLGLWSPTTCNGNTEMQTAEEIEPQSSDQANDQPVDTNSGYKWYTSSYGTAKYYYPESCSGWEGLSQKYLEGFYSLEELLAGFPTWTLSPQCQ